MPHVSPRPTNRVVLEKIYKLLTGAISDSNISSKQRRIAFDELLTPTEKIMLGKRLAAISLLSQGMSSYRVGKLLQLSTTTTAKLGFRLESDKLSGTEKLCSNLRKGPLKHYFENLLKPLPRYGTSPASLLRSELEK